MAHPFEKLFEKALKKSTVDDNLVLKEAARLTEKGYPKGEICAVLSKLEKSLIDDSEGEIVNAAREKICDEEA